MPVKLECGWNIGTLAGQENTAEWRKPVPGFRGATLRLTCTRITVRFSRTEQDVNVVRRGANAVDGLPWMGAGELALPRDALVGIQQPKNMCALQQHCPIVSPR